MAEVKTKISDPLVVILLFLFGIVLSSMGIINPIAVGITGLVAMLLLFIMPYLEKAGIIETSEQKFVYSLLIVFFSLFVYGLEERGVIPILSLSGNVLIDAVTSTVIYSLVILLLVLVPILYLNRNKIEKYIRR